MILVIILAYPALSTATVSIALSSSKIADAEHVYATVGNVWIHHSGYSQSAGWEVVSNQTQTVDLVTLTNNAMSFPRGQVPVGGYDAVRMELTNVTWVYNKTTTRLSVQSTQLQARLQFTLQAGGATTITMTIGGHQEEIQGSKFFLSNLNATIGGPPR
jgi:glycine cleavage system aminomethyltransferase T